MSSEVLLRQILAAYAFVSFNDPVVGRTIIIALCCLLIVWLLLIPNARIGQAKRVPPLWRNIRMWAILVAVIQMLIYIVWN